MDHDQRSKNTDKEPDNHGTENTTGANELGRLRGAEPLWSQLRHEKKTALTLLSSCFLLVSTFLS